jgi:magnesium-transporting ATPase (P-type)
MLPIAVAEEGVERRRKLKEDQEQLEKKLDAITTYADVYARAKPVDKITIVRSLQRQVLTVAEVPGS